MRFFAGIHTTTPRRFNHILEKYASPAPLRSGHRLAWALGLVLMAGSPPGFAQGQIDGQLEEIVVTATRREQSVQDAPASITVFKTESLRSSQIDDLRSVGMFTPGLSVGGYAALGVNPLSIRGIGQNPTGVGADDAVAVYRDGVYLGRGYADVFDFVDTDRVEVLKGPQGALYGRNATGGAINIVSRQPGGAFEARLETRLGNLGERMVRGLVGGPVDDKVALQLAVSDRHLDGFVATAVWAAARTRPRCGGRRCSRRLTISESIFRRMPIGSRSGSTQNC